MCFKHILWKCLNEKKSYFPPEGLKDMELACSDPWEITVNQQLWAQQQTAVTGIWNDKSCRQRLGNSFPYLQAHSHTIQRSWLGAPRAVLAPASAPRALQEGEPSLGEAPAAHPGPAQAPSPAFHRHCTIPKRISPPGHIGQGCFPCSYLGETSISWCLVLFQPTGVNHPEILWFCLECRGFPDNSWWEVQSAWKPSPLCSSQCRLHAVQLGANMEIKIDREIYRQKEYIYNLLNYILKYKYTKHKLYKHNYRKLHKYRKLYKLLKTYK